MSSLHPLMGIKGPSLWGMPCFRLMTCRSPMCSFFLQLTLLDLECSMLPASLLAAASLANSLEVYGKEVWPAIVQQYSAYTHADITWARKHIQSVRASLCSALMHMSWLYSPSSKRAALSCKSSAAVMQNILCYTALGHL